MHSKTILGVLLVLVILHSDAMAFDPSDPSNTYDYVILTHDSLFLQAERLHNHRNITMRSCIVKTSEVTAAFTGENDVQKIRAFILYAYENWKIAPTYLLLIGDTRIALPDPADDPDTPPAYNNYMVDGVEYNLIPSMLEFNEFEEWYGNAWFTNDNWYVKPFLPDDNKPIMHIGRISARNVSELQNFVDKIVYYDSINDNPSWLRNILMLVGDKYVNINNDIYRTLNDELYDEEFSECSPTPFTLYSSDYLLDDWPDEATADTRSAWNSGCGYVNAFGNTHWYGSLVLMAEFFASTQNPPDDPFTESLMHNNRLPVVFAGTCICNYFYLNHDLCISEDLLLSSPDRGAIAFIGATHINDIIESKNINKTFAHKLMSEGINNVGRLFSSAVGLYIAEGNRGHETMKKQYMLMGDPATDLKIHPLPPPTEVINGIEIEDAPILQNTIIEKSSGISGDNVRIAHGENEVLPLISERMLRVTLNDSVTGNSDYIEWMLLEDLVIPITQNMHFSYWINILESPGGNDKLAIDGRVIDKNNVEQRIGESFVIVDHNGIPLKAEHRIPFSTSGWHFIYTDLSPLQGGTLKDIRLRYGTSVDTESGNLIAYIDDIRVQQIKSYKSMEIINHSFEEDVNQDNRPDFWSTILLEPPPFPQIITRRDVVPASDGRHFMQIFNENCLPGQGAEHIFHSNKEIDIYNIDFDYRAPDSTTFTFKIVDADLDPPEIFFEKTDFSAVTTWNSFSTSINNPGFGIVPRRIKIQFIPNTCADAIYIDDLRVNQPIITTITEHSPSSNKIFLSSSPNPFNPSTTITYEIPKRCQISIRIYDVNGRLVKNLYDGKSPAGRHKAIWDGRGNSGQCLSSGVYFAKLESPFGQKTFKMIILK